MRHYRNIFKKPSGKNFLTKSTASVNTIKLRDITNLANRLKFRFFKITALKQYPKSNLTTAAKNSIFFCY